ncbi:MULTISPECIES: hypothetical protein [Halorussus]|uniref:hypothetical protein n=1 Tax=Halorussus TaxID=1070314 RepID=UPI00209EA2B0|nr:hypothetical protein [Halorussus vallis]USZ75324.1 hypothetical protein NGM07_18060 [Halorussus vallis]
MNTDRRRLLGALAGVAAGGAGLASLLPAAHASADADFAAEDVTVASDDGNVRGVTVAPAGTVAWRGLDEPAGRVALSLYAKLDADYRYRKLATDSLSARGLHGETAYDFGALDLLDREGFAAADFSAADGETRTRRLRLRLAFEVYAAAGETALARGYADAVFDVTVENLAGSGDVDGDAAVAVETQTTETTATETAASTATETATETETSTATDSTASTTSTTTAERTTATTSGTTTEETTDDGA